MMAALPGVARAAETVASKPPETGPVVDAAAGGGWTQLGFRYGTDAIVSAPSFEGAVRVGYRVGPLDAGATTGVLLTTSLRDVAPGQPTPRTPDTMTLAHAGAFSGWHPARLRPMGLHARAELAYAWLTQVQANVPAPFAFATIRTHTALGGLAGVGASYAWNLSGRTSLVAALDGYAGLLRGDGSLQIIPRGLVASLGFDWR
jgi:hypothetical protein